MKVDRLLDKWRAMLTGGLAAAEDQAVDPFRSGKTGKLTALARQYWTTIDWDSGDGLWPDLPKAGSSRLLHTNYVRLKAMAMALETKEGALYRNEDLANAILRGLQWAYDNLYNEHSAVHGNWWYWEIGVPSALLDTLVLMHGRLSSESIAAHLRAVDRCAPDPERILNTVKDDPHISTGANRVWKCRVCFFSAMLKGDGATMELILDRMGTVFDYVTTGDGFYKDGSYIQHKRFAYTGGYGKELIQALGDLLYFLHGSPWEMKQERIAPIYRWVEDAFEPLVFKGLMADMVSGREISRFDQQNYHSGHAVLGGLLRLIAIAPSEKAARMKRTVKDWLAGNTLHDYAESAPPDLAAAAWQLLRDESVEPRAEYRLSKVYGRMDRAIHQRPSHAFGISMFSNRIVAYESINGENLRGWHTAHGMTYLYNGDLAQYNDGFWPTVDPYRLPGTTVSARPRADKEGDYKTSNKPFAGGAVLQGLYGAVGMELEEPGEFEARKSWFLFDDEIVALGSGIRAFKPVPVETIVDNRMLGRRGGSSVMVLKEGATPSVVDDGADETLNVRWVHLKGEATGADIGYMFPGRQQVRLLRETRIGKWSDISTTGPKEELSRPYLTMWFDHGVQPDDGRYAYVLLPGWSMERVAAYEERPHAEIIESSSEIHAVKAPRLQLLGVQFWEDKRRSVGLLTCSRKASILVKEGDTALEFAVGDPTQENADSIIVEWAAAASRVAAKDERITVISLCPVIRFEVDTRGAGGESRSIVFVRPQTAE